MTVKWTIAILTVPQRRREYERLLDALWPQIEHGSGISLMTCNMPGTIAEKRQWCLDNAEGEYFNFIDDDDMVPDDYVASIYPHLNGVDYIGFQLQLYWDGRPMKPTFHSLEYDHWSEDYRGYYRNISHLNPIRTEIARQGRFAGGYGEDRRWAEQVNPRTEYYVDKVLYHYLYSPEGSLSGG